MGTDQPETNTITAGMDRKNSRIFAASNMLIYFASPVVYVGIAQAALCDKLGASATVANLPVSAYFFGFFAPVLLAWLIPYRLEKSAVVTANLVTSSSLVLVALSLFLPFEDGFRLVAVIGQGLILGFADSISIVYMYQCLNRGTNLPARAKALKWSFSLGPLFAVAGNLLAQFILSGGIASLPHPTDFAVLYLIASVCTAGVAVLSSQYELISISSIKEPFLQSMRATVRSFLQSRTLALLWLAYLLFFIALNAMTNLSLYSREALGEDPKEFAGYMNALRFGFKAITGFGLGLILARWGIRAPLVTTVLLVATGILWAWTVPGYFYLLAFGLLGGGELGGAYFPNYVVSISSPATSARNLAFLTLVTPISSFAPLIYGALTDSYGFSASFILGVSIALLALWLVFRLPTQARERVVSSE